MIIWLSSNFERFAIYGMRDIFKMSKLWEFIFETKL